jgi:hypothetical protein
VAVLALICVMSLAGTEYALLNCRGLDITAHFESYHPFTERPRKILAAMKPVGGVSRSEVQYRTKIALSGYPVDIVHRADSTCGCGHLQVEVPPEVLAQRCEDRSNVSPRPLDRSRNVSLCVRSDDEV